MLKNKNDVASICTYAVNALQLTSRWSRPQAGGSSRSLKTRRVETQSASLYKYEFEM